MSQRLQVVMSAADLEEIRDAARRNRETMSAWVRRVLRSAADRERRGGADVVREALPAYSGKRPVQVRFVSVEARPLEDDVEALRERYGLATWRAAVEEAVCRQVAAPMTKAEALAMEGVGWEGDLDEMRDAAPVEDIGSEESRSDRRRTG